MKKIILITAILLVSLSTLAQSKARFGLRAGANLSKLSNLETKNKTDFYFGALLALKINESYTLQPELTYSRQGAELASNTILKEANSHLKNINIDFFSIAVMNKISTNNNISFLIGPYLDIRMDDNVQGDEYFFEGLFPRMDVGITVGLAYDISDSFSIEARFKHGFADMINEHDIYEDVQRDDSNYTQVFQLGIAYKFDLKQAK